MGMTAVFRAYKVLASTQVSGAYNNSPSTYRAAFQRKYLLVDDTTMASTSSANRSRSAVSFLLALVLFSLQNGLVAAADSGVDETNNETPSLDAVDSEDGVKASTRTSSRTRRLAGGAIAGIAIGEFKLQ